MTDDDYDEYMTHVFGDLRPEDPRRHTATPVGEPCSACGHAIEDGDSGVRTPLLLQPGNPDYVPDWAYYHYHCFMLMIGAPL